MAIAERNGRARSEWQAGKAERAAILLVVIARLGRVRRGRDNLTSTANAS